MTRLGPSGAELYAEQLRTCRRKRTYLSRTTAANAAFLLALVPTMRPVEPYRCAYCGDWHLCSKRSA